MKITSSSGDAENARQEIGGLKFGGLLTLQGWKMQDWKMQD